MSIRVVLVDDQELVRAGFRMVLGAQPDIDVVGEAADGAAAVRLLESLKADVVLMDVRMPRVDGVEATRLITAMPGPPRVLILTTFDLDEYAFTALKAGASGFLLKDVPPSDLISAIHSVHAGDAVVAPSTTRRLLRRFTAHLPGTPAAEPESLSRTGPPPPLSGRTRSPFPGLMVRGSCGNSVDLAEFPHLSLITA
ncbi:response regulator transcription factor [Sphaerisporangium sp. NPDC088356]|uniref:response regulator n=1 Tax=Sphaerisporangium sp. NPDC088356 TaxID=3154871 RepID=UPI003419C52C